MGAFARETVESLKVALMSQAGSSSAMSPAISSTQTLLLDFKSSFITKLAYLNHVGKRQSSSRLDFRPNMGYAPTTLLHCCVRCRCTLMLQTSAAVAPPPSGKALPPGPKPPEIPSVIPEIAALSFVDGSVQKMVLSIENVLSQVRMTLKSC